MEMKGKKMNKRYMKKEDGTIVKYSKKVVKEELDCLLKKQITKLGNTALAIWTTKIAAKCIANEITEKLFRGKKIGHCTSVKKLQNMVDTMLGEAGLVSLGQPKTAEKSEGGKEEGEGMGKRYMIRGDGDVVDYKKSCVVEKIETILSKRKNGVPYSHYILNQIRLTAENLADDITEELPKGNTVRNCVSEEEINKIVEKKLRAMGCFEETDTVLLYGKVKDFEKNYEEKKTNEKEEKTGLEEKFSKEETTIILKKGILRAYGIPENEDNLVSRVAMLAAKELTTQITLKLFQWEDATKPISRKEINKTMGDVLENAGLGKVWEEMKEREIKKNKEEMKEKKI